MPTKFQLITELYDQTVQSVTGSYQSWTGFLRAACYNYKCPFDDQILIYAQRPDATAVLEMERWNRQFGRWVNRGAKSIAVQQGQEEKVLALAAQHGMEDFYAEKYLNTLRVGAETESNELFDKSHGFYIAVIQGFFRDYYYTRGSAFSFLVEQKPEYARYFTSWEQITPVSFPNPMQNRIIENYCSGVYLSPDQVIQLLKDMEQDPKVLEDLEGLWSNGQIAVLKKALSAAAKSGVGLLEATEVVEPNPISPNESTSYSNLYHCDRDGVYLYIDAVSGQLADAIGKNEG